MFATCGLKHIRQLQPKGNGCRSSAEKGSEAKTRLKRKEFYNQLAMSALSTTELEVGVGTFQVFAFSGLYLVLIG